MLDFIPEIPSPYLEVLSSMLAVWMLYYSSKILIECALTIGKKLNLSEIFIGITLIAWVTSLPEILVMINSIVLLENDASSAVYGTILGSNLANLSLVLGLGILFSGENFVAQAVNLRSRFIIISIATLCLVGYPLIESNRSYLPTLLSLAMAVSIIFYIFISYKESHVVDSEETIGAKNRSLFYSLFWLAVSITLMWVGTTVISVHGANAITLLGWSPIQTGGIFFALCTSAPEIITSLVAILKFKKSELVLGNVIGSNIANIFAFGLISFYWSLDISPVKNVVITGLLLIVAEIATFVLCLYYLKKNQVKIPYWHGLSLIVIYYVFVRII